MSSSPCYGTQAAVCSILAIVDPDKRRTQLRDPTLQRDRRIVNELADTVVGEGAEPRTAVLLARCLARNQAIKKAAAVLYQAQARFPADLHVNVELALLLKEPPLQRLEEAAGLFRAALAHRPQSPGLLTHLGDVLRRLGRHDQANLAFRRALDLEPRSAEAYRCFTENLAAEQDWQQLSAVYEQWVRWFPNNQYVYSQQAQVYGNARKWEQALDALRRAAAVKPAAHNEDRLAWLLATCPDASLRNPTEALAHARRAVELSGATKLKATGRRSA